MKKAVLYCCAAALAFSLAACGKDTQENGGTQESSGAQGTEQAGASGGAATGGASESEGSVTGNIPESGSSGADGVSDSGGSEESSGWGDLGVDGWSEEMAEIRAAVVEAVGEDNYWPDMPMTSDLFEAYYGITPDMCEDYMAETPMISGNVDALIVIKAKEGQAGTVEATMNAYRDRLVNDTMQYPVNLSKIQASQVEQMGDYTVFVQLGGDTMDKPDEEAIRQCQEANELALEAIRKIIGEN